MIQGFSPLALNQLSHAMGGGGGAVTVVIDLSVVEDRLKTMCGQLDSLTEMVANPDAVAASEKLRKGQLAMKQGWHADAVPELLASIDAYRFRALPHLLLGVARLHVGESVDAMESLMDAVRYGASADPRAGLTAALLAAAVLDAAGQSDRANEVLAAAGSYGESPEVLAARLEHGDLDAQARLLELVESNSGDIPRTLLGEQLGPRYEERRLELESAVISLNGELARIEARIARATGGIHRATIPEHENSQAISYALKTFIVFGTGSGEWVLEHRLPELERWLGTHNQLRQRAADASTGLRMREGLAIPELLGAGRRVRDRIDARNELVAALRAHRAEGEALLAAKPTRPSVDFSYHKMSFRRELTKRQKALVAANERMVHALLVEVRRCLASLPAMEDTERSSIASWELVDRRPPKRQLIRALADVHVTLSATA